MKSTIVTGRHSQGSLYRALRRRHCVGSGALVNFDWRQYCPELLKTYGLPPIFRRPSTKIRDKSPLVQILSQLFAGNFVRGVLSGRFCPGWLLSVPVLSEYICYNRKLDITLNFMFRMYDKKFISVTSHALYPPSPCHNLSHLLGPLPPRA